MTDRLSRCRYSTGSSIVTMCLAWLLLMWSTIAASVVDLPDPVTPVSSTIPRSSSASALTARGRLRSSIERTENGIARQASEIVRAGGRR